MRRPGVIPVCLFIFLVASTATALDAGTIVRNGEPQSVIVLQPDAPAQLSEAVSVYIDDMNLFRMKEEG
jgi:hypothetical protein